MNKLAMLVVVLAMLGSNAAFAETSGNMGKGSSAGANAASSSGVAWGVGLGALAVLGIVVGVSAGSASSTPSNFSH